jgi:hypothetical protein
LFGGEGSTEMVHIAQALNRAACPVQLILLCGKNKEVISELRAMDLRIPMLIEGFTRCAVLHGTVRLLRRQTWTGQH